MSRLEEILKMDNLAEGAKDEIRNAKDSVNDLQAISNVAESVGGQKLLEMLQDDCRDLLLKVLKAKEDNEVDKVMTLLSDFQAKFTLFNTIKSAPKEYADADEALSERLDEILEG